MTTAANTESQLASRVAPAAVSLKRVLRLAGGTGAAQALTVATMPIVTRLYLPEDFSSLGLFMSFLGIALVFSSLKYEFAIVSTKTERQAVCLLLACLAMSVPVSIVAVCVLLLLKVTGAFGYGVLPLTAILLMAPTVVVTSAF